MLDTVAAQRILDDSPFGKWWGFSVEDVRAGHARLRLPARPEFYRPGGVLQGGCAMTLADVAFWVAIMTMTGPDGAGVTLGQTSTFLRAGRTDLVCDADVLRPGATIMYGTANVLDTSYALIAHHTLTYVRRQEVQTRR